LLVENTYALALETLACASYFLLFRESLAPPTKFNSWLSVTDLLSSQLKTSVKSGFATIYQFIARTEMIPVYLIQQGAFNFTSFLLSTILTLWHLKPLRVPHTFFYFENFLHHPLNSISGFQSLICFLLNLKAPPKAGLQ